MVDSDFERALGSLWNNPAFQPLKELMEQRVESLIEKMISGRKEETMRENAARVKELQTLLRRIESAFKENQKIR